MTLVNRDNEAELKVVSQTKLDKTDTVYNFEVAEFHTYHIGEFGVWVHNDCWVANKLPWNKGKLGEHFGNHSEEFAATSSQKYSEMAFDFGQRPKDDSLIDLVSGAFKYRYQPSTKMIFFGTLSGGKVKTFYKWDGRSDDAVINSLKGAGSL